MLPYLAAVWRSRYFWFSLVKMDLRTRYRRSVLGLGWSLLHPIAMMIILCSVFATVFKVSVEEYGPFVLGGLACWNFIVGCTTQGCQCFFLGEPYIRQYPSPLAIFPLRTALGNIVHFLIALSIVLVLTWVVKGFANLASLWCLLPTLLLIFVLAWSLAVLAGSATVYFQDTQHICEVGFQMLFYATPIIYKVGNLRETGLEWMLNYNPLVAFLDLVRIPILEAQVPAAQTFVTATLIAAAVLLAAGLTLARLQRRLIFHL